MSNSQPLSARLFSIEMVIWFLSTAFVFGAGYTALAMDNGDNKVAIVEIRSSQKDVIKDIQSIKTDVAVIKAGQKSSERRMVRQESDISRILNILEKRNGP